MAVSVHDGRGRPGLGVPAGDDVTRYLCAAAYLDPRFARDVLDELLLEPSRGVAPVPGADPEPVVRHCAAALRRSVRRDLLLTGIVLAAAVLTGLQGLLIAIWLFSWALVARGMRYLSIGEIGRGVRLLLVFLLVSLACGFGLLLRSDTGSSGRLGISLQSTQVLLLVVAALWIVVYLDRVSVFTALSERLSPGAFDPHGAPDLPDRWRERLGYVRGVRSCNLSVYAQRAPTAPFTGFGPAVHTWSVSSRLDPASTSSPAPGPDGDDVYAALRLAGQQAGYEVSDLVLMPGLLPDGHPFLDPAGHRPMQRLAPPIVADIAAHPGATESYHQVWSPAAPGTGPTVTGFVQVSIKDGQLAVDVALTALPAVEASYRVADRSVPASPVLMFGMLGATLIDVGRRTPQAPVNLARTGLRRWQRRPEGSTEPDLGARAGLRELAARRDPAPQAGDYEATRQVNQLSRELATAMARVLVALGFDPAAFSSAAGPVWQKSLRVPGGQTSQGRIP